MGAALLTGAGDAGRGVELAAAAWATWLGDVAAALPLGYAFGMVAAVNPCGVALLPAYLGIYLGDVEGPAPSPERSGPYGRLPRRALRALWISAIVSAGFVFLFGIAGLALSLAAAALVRLLPWVGFAVGVLLVLAGGRMLGGGALYAGLGEQMAGRLGAEAQARGARAYLAYGLAYGTASLSCTLPIFLAVVGSTLTVAGVLPAAAQFVLYGLGMGFVISLLTLGVALFKAAVVAKVRRGARYVYPASVVLLLLAGAYIIYYWLTQGGLLAAAGIR